MFDAKEEAAEILEENDFNAVLLITVDQNDRVQWAVKVRQQTSPISMHLIGAVQNALIGDGVANKLKI